METCSDDAAVRYQAYSRLQAAALALGETLPIPEIVVRLLHLLLTAWWTAAARAGLAALRTPMAQLSTAVAMTSSIMACSAGHRRPVGRQKHAARSFARGESAHSFGTAGHVLRMPDCASSSAWLCAVPFQCQRRRDGHSKASHRSDGAFAGPRGASVPPARCLSKPTSGNHPCLHRQSSCDKHSCGTVCL